jgi:hypothetical protein
MVTKPAFYALANFDTNSRMEEHSAMYLTMANQRFQKGPKRDLKDRYY